MAKDEGRIEVTVLGHRYPVRASGSARDRARVDEALTLLESHLDTIARATGEVDRGHLAVMAALALADEVLTLTAQRETSRADDAAFRQVLRQRSERLLGIVEEEIEARLEVAQ
ncbi:MAG: cell division protein ZapA [Deltaproteobacteria bacterium]|nr:cell division protein ZapA [Deltaproteobacteria bacterium]